MEPRSIEEQFAEYDELTSLGIKITDVMPADQAAAGIRYVPSTTCREYREAWRASGASESFPAYLNRHLTK